MAANNKKSNDSSAALKALQEDIKAGSPHTLYFFHGEEHYLMDRLLGQLRSQLIPEGLGEFNHHRLEGSHLTPALLQESVDMLPAFSERTLIEVWDYDPYKQPEADRDALQSMLTDLPDYLCLVFVYDTIPYSPDRRLKMFKALEACSRVVEFALQDTDKVVRWINRHVAEEGKSISQKDAEYLCFLTGGQMTALNTEIAKLCSSAEGPSITKADIDQYITPTVEAEAFKLADAIVDGKYQDAAQLLSNIQQLQEAPQRVLAALNMVFRRLLNARLCLDAKKDVTYLQQHFKIPQPFAAKNAMSSARRLTTEQCRNMVLLCAEAALQANSGKEDCLTELLVNLCQGRKAALL